MNVVDKNEAMRHTLSHIMAMAVSQEFSEVKFGIGPSIDNGFYYDFMTEEPIKEGDLDKVSDRMQKIINSDLPMNHKKVSKDEARELFKNQPYKLELIEEIEDSSVSIYQIGDDGFVDLCKGPHVESTGKVGAFKLTEIAGAYWRGSEENDMLQRIYAVAFEDEEKLEDYLKLQEELKQIDHRKLGKKLHLFMIDEKVGAGLIMWLPRGAFLRKQVMDFALNTYLDNGYEPVYTPHIASTDLWKTSGHWDFYREDMYEEFGIDEKKYTLKPMNCPYHVLMYKSQVHSYRELPIRWTEMGTVYRYEKAGQLGGLTRVRGFTQDDAHIICTPEQVEYELKEALRLTFQILDRFDFEDYELNLSTHNPDDMDKYIGNSEEWEKIEETLRKVAKEEGHGLNEDKGEAAFYGPKIDLKVEDVMGRKWQLSTLQVDFNLPKRFDMTYTDKEGNDSRPIMIHRALLGSLERFIGVLIEHYKGIFPLWLSQEQARVIPINDNLIRYAEEVQAELQKYGVRVTVDDKTESMQKKIRNAELEKIRYMLIVGDKEKSTNTVSVRSLVDGEKGLMSQEEFVKLVRDKIATEKKPTE
jgi:threonyl-tRNA synthetase